MKFGLGTITRGIFGAPDAYKAIAAAAEKAGFDFIAVTDHLVVPAELESHYPYVPGGAFKAVDDGSCLDQLSTMSFLAACTTRVRLLSSVMVVPHRPAMLAAKMLATLDVLSKGRLILGVGAGWLREEFELLGANFPDRGAVTDEHLAAFKELWTKDRPQFAGTHVKFKDVIFHPKPVQKPHPPLWIGGESKGAIRRAIRLGDCWYPGNNSQTQPLDTPARLAAGIKRVREQAEATGRDPKSLGVSLLVQDHFEWVDAKVNDGSHRRMFTGTSAQMLEDADALTAIGVGHAALRLGGASIAEAVGRIERFGAEVIAKHRG